MKGLGAALLAGMALAFAPAPAAAQGEVVEYYATDAIGSTRVVFAPDGSVKAQSDYLPFGEALNATGNLPPQRFTGQERDGEAGLDNFNARGLATRVGRFGQIDPAGGALSNPQTWNRYAYVLNNPIALNDPTGAYADSGLFDNRMCSAENSFGACGGSDRFWLDGSGGGGLSFGDGYARATRDGYFEGMPDIMWEGLQNMQANADAAFIEAQQQRAEVTWTEEFNVSAEDVPQVNPYTDVIGMAEPTVTGLGNGAVLGVGGYGAGRLIGTAVRAAMAWMTAGAFTVDKVMRSPNVLAGKNPTEVLMKLGRLPSNWRSETLGAGSHRGMGLVIREYNARGLEPTGRMIRYHPGGGHHGPSPYWLVNNGSTNVRIGPQFPKP